MVNINDNASKFSWRIMSLTMVELKEILLFFREFLKNKSKGISNLLEKIDFYDEEDKILTPSLIDLSQVMNQFSDLPDVQNVTTDDIEVYYLFMRAP